MQIFKDENKYGAFSVSNLFISDYMAMLGGDAVKLYLYLCYLYENKKRYYAKLIDGSFDV